MKEKFRHLTALFLAILMLAASSGVAEIQPELEAEISDEEFEIEAEAEFQMETEDNADANAETETAMDVVEYEAVQDKAVEDEAAEMTTEEIPLDEVEAEEDDIEVAVEESVEVEAMEDSEASEVVEEDTEQEDLDLSLALEEEVPSLDAEEIPVYEATPAASNSGFIPIDKAHFPDAGFREWISYEVDSNYDDELSPSEISAVTEADVYEVVKSLKGIEYFTSLKTLECSCGELTSLDLSGLGNLVKLDCSNNKLTSLDLSGLSNLEELNCSVNRLTSLDVSAAKSLIKLDCSGNNLASLDLGGSSNLEELDCCDNRINDLDVRGCAKLRILNCQNNVLTSIDVNENAVLWRLYITDNYLSKLDVSHNPQLEVLQCENNQLAKLNVSVVPALKVLCCSGNRLSSLDVSGNPELTALCCQSNAIKTLNISACPNLQKLAVPGRFIGWSECWYTYGQGFDEGDEFPDLLFDTATLLTFGGTRMSVVKLHKNCSGSARKGYTVLVDLKGSKAKSVKSSNAKVATVALRSGVPVITPKKAGKTTITVTLKNNKKRTLTLKVTGGTAPTGVTLSKTGTYKVYLGDTGHLKAYLSPAGANSTLRWKSSNGNIAKVNANGVITPKKTGTVTITVTTANKKKASVKVQVLDPNLPVSVKLKKSGSLYKTQKLKLKATLNFARPDLVDPNRKHKLTWKTSDKTIAKVSSNGTVTALKPGKVSITVTTENKKKATFKLTVKKGSVIKGDVSKLMGADVDYYDKMKQVADPMTFDGNDMYYNNDFGVVVDEYGSITHIMIMPQATSGKYSLFFVYPGMSWSMSVGTLANYGWKPAHNSPSDTLYLNADEPDYAVVMEKGSDGKVKSIMYGYMGD